MQLLIFISKIKLIFNFVSDTLISSFETLLNGFLLEKKTLLCVIFLNASFFLNVYFKKLDEYHFFKYQK